MRLLRLAARVPRPVIAGCILLLGILGAVLYYRFDPESGFFPQCLFKVTTGLDCPGCGSQRALHALLRGDIGEAWGYNALFVAELPVIAVLLVLWTLPGRFPRAERLLYSRTFILAVLAAIIIWTIIRNI